MLPSPTEKKSKHGTIHLVVGYAGTGKDTFCRMIQHGYTLAPKEFPGHWWRIYAPPGANAPRFGRVTRVAFADALKETVVRKIGLPNRNASLNSAQSPIWPQYEKQKNTLKIKNEAGQMVTLRQHYIEYGQKKKLEDPQYWCKVALDPYKDQKVELFSTDTRFPVEVKYSQDNFEFVPTYRVFRANVGIAKPVPVEDPEHSLDVMQTDYLLVPSEEDFEAAVKLFPQYKDYVCRWFIGPNH